MSITRVTQNMMTQRSLAGLQGGLSRVADLQEQVSSGKRLTRPSDSPADTVSAMRLRSSIAEVAQHRRNAEDGQGWLSRVDQTLQSAIDQTRKARELGLQGANTGAGSATSREALAVEIEQLRDSVLTLANAQHLGRPVFGGVTAGSVAYDARGSFVGVRGEVSRTVGEGVKVRVDLDAEAAFGPEGRNLFDNLSAMAAAVRAGDTAAVRGGLDAVAGDLDRLGVALADVGSRATRVDRAMQSAVDRELELTGSLARVENVDLPVALMELQMQESAYQAALAATSRVMQPSLLDFMR